MIRTTIFTMFMRIVKNLLSLPQKESYPFIH